MSGSLTSTSGLTSASTLASATSWAASASWSTLSSFFSSLREEVGVLDEWGVSEGSLWPEIWGKITVGLLEGMEESVNEVLSGSGLTGRLGVNIIDTSELEDLLGNLGSNTTGTSWGWDESDAGGTALTVDLGWDGMDTTDSSTPITSSNWDEVALGRHKGTLDGNLDFLSELGTETNMTVSVTASNNSLKSGSLTGLSLLLNGFDAHNFIGKGDWFLGVLEEGINDLVLLDWDGEGVDLFKGDDLSVFDQSTELGEWGPFVLAESTSLSTSGTTSATSASTEASGWSFSSLLFSWSSLSLLLSFHFYCVFVFRKIIINKIK